MNTRRVKEWKRVDCQAVVVGVGTLSEGAEVAGARAQPPKANSPTLGSKSDKTRAKSAKTMKQVGVRTKRVQQ